MSEQFKLVFRGEIEADQHLAVVRKRLGALLKADDKTLVALFSGQAVVLRKEIDAAGAAKFQAAFRKAGAKLRVIPHAALKQDAAVTQAAGEPATTATEAPRKPTLAERLKAAEAAEVAAQQQPPTPAAAQGTTAEGNGSAANGLQLYPVGADLLETHELLPPATSTVDVSHLTVAEVGERIGPVVEIMADTDRFMAAAAAFELADTGADMAPRDPEVPPPLASPELGLAPVGAELLEGVTVPSPPEVAAPTLDLSAPGVDLVEPAPPTRTPAPDTTHLELVTAPDQD